MSRADELVRMAADAAGVYVRAGGRLVLFEDAAKVIRDLEAERDGAAEGIRHLRRGVVANAGRVSDSLRPRWAHVMDATGLGSTSARELCEAAGYDPDEIRRGRTPVPSDRADELILREPGFTGEITSLRRAQRIVGELESTIATRDARIAELKCLVDEQHDYLVQAVDQARAEVPEWCQEVVRQLYVWTSSCPPEHEADYLLGKVCLDLTTDQLRACGIEGP